MRSRKKQLLKIRHMKQVCFRKEKWNFRSLKPNLYFKNHSLLKICQACEYVDVSLINWSISDLPAFFVQSSVCTAVTAAVRLVGLSVPAVSVWPSSVPSVTWPFGAPPTSAWVVVTEDTPVTWWTGSAGRTSVRPAAAATVCCRAPSEMLQGQKPTHLLTEGRCGGTDLSLWSTTPSCDHRGGFKMKQLMATSVRPTLCSRLYSWSPEDKSLWSFLGTTPPLGHHKNWNLMVVRSSWESCSPEDQLSLFWTCSSGWSVVFQH